MGVLGLAAGLPGELLGGGGAEPVDHLWQAVGLACDQGTEAPAVLGDLALGLPGEGAGEKASLNRIFSRKGCRWGRGPQNSATAEARLQFIPPRRKQWPERGARSSPCPSLPVPAAGPPCSPAHGVPVPQDRGGEKQQKDVESHRGAGPGVILETHARSGPSGVRLRPLPRVGEFPGGPLELQESRPVPTTHAGKNEAYTRRPHHTRRASLEPGFPRPTRPPSPGRHS